jgi:hypothetical protein
VARTGRQVLAVAEGASRDEVVATVRERLAQIVTPAHQE